MKDLFDIPIELYKAHLIVYFGEDNKRLQRSLDRFDAVEIKPLSVYHRARAGEVSTPTSGLFLLQLRKIPKFNPGDIGTLTHEISHITFRVLRRAGVKLCVKSEETYTYLNDYIMTKIIEKIKK